MRVHRFLHILTFLAVVLSSCGKPEPSSSRSPALPDSGAGGAEQSSPGNERIILFLGNSLSAGYGLDPSEAFPALIQRRIDSLGWSFQVVNAGLSGETTAGGLRRADWLFRQQVDVLVLELGGNDGLRGIPPEETRANLGGIMDLARARHPHVALVLAGMQVPPNLGGLYTNSFRKVFPEVARAHDAHLIPFLLDGVGGIPGLNQRDGIHPTAEGHRIVAENVWVVLGPLLAELMAGVAA